MAVWNLCMMWHSLTCDCTGVCVLLQPGIVPGAGSWSSKAGSSCRVSADVDCRALFGSLAALPLAPNTAVARRTEQRRGSVSVCLSVSLHTFLNFWCADLKRTILGMPLVLVTSAGCWISCFPFLFVFAVSARVFAATLMLFLFCFSVCQQQTLLEAN